MEASSSAGGDTHDYSQTLQAAWRRLIAHDPSLEALETVLAISQANLTQIEDAITAKRNSICNPSICPIDPRLLQSDGTGPVITPFTTFTAPEARTTTNFNGVGEDFHVQNLGSETYGSENTWPMPPIHDRSFPQSLAIGGHVPTGIGDSFAGRAQDMGIVSSGAKRLIWPQHRMADPRPISHSSPRISDLTEHQLELLNLLPDHIIAAEYQNPYNPQWTTEYHISDTQVRDVFAVFRAGAKFDDLFNKGIWRVGDILRVETGYVRDVYLAIHSVERGHKGQPYPCMQFLEDQSASPTGSVGCKGPREIVEAVKKHYNAFKDLNTFTPWAIVHLIRDGVELGSLDDVRERHTLWNMQVALWAAKNNVVIGGRRFIRKEGSYATFPTVKFR